MDGVFSFISEMIRNRSDSKPPDVSSEFSEIWQTIVVEKVEGFNNPVEYSNFTSLFSLDKFCDNSYERLSGYIEKIKKLYQNSTSSEWQSMVEAWADRVCKDNDNPLLIDILKRALQIPISNRSLTQTSKQLRGVWAVHGASPGQLSAFSPICNSYIRKLFSLFDQGLIQLLGRFFGFTGYHPSYAIDIVVPLLKEEYFRQISSQLLNPAVCTNQVVPLVRQVLKLKNSSDFDEIVVDIIHYPFGRRTRLEERFNLAVRSLLLFLRSDIRVIAFGGMLPAAELDVLTQIAIDMMTALLRAKQFDLRACPLHGFEYDEHGQIVSTVKLITNGHAPTVAAAVSLLTLSLSRSSFQDFMFRQTGAFQKHIQQVINTPHNHLVLLGAGKIAEMALSFLNTINAVPNSLTIVDLDLEKALSLALKILDTNTYTIVSFKDGQTQSYNPYSATWEPYPLAYAGGIGSDDLTSNKITGKPVCFILSTRGGFSEQNHAYMAALKHIFLDQPYDQAPAISILSAVSGQNAGLRDLIARLLALHTYTNAYAQKTEVCAVADDYPVVIMPVVLDLITRKIKQGSFTEAIRLLLWLKNNFSGVTLTMPADYLEYIPVDERLFTETGVGNTGDPLLGKPLIGNNPFTKVFKFRPKRVKIGLWGCNAGALALTAALQVMSGDSQKQHLAALFAQLKDLYRVEPVDQKPAKDIVAAMFDLFEEMMPELGVARTLI